jgi:hypothetical protein
VDVGGQEVSRSKKTLDDLRLYTDHDYFMLQMIPSICRCLEKSIRSLIDLGWYGGSNVAVEMDCGCI